MNKSKGSIMAVLSLIVMLSLLLLVGVSSAAEKFPSREIILVVVQAAGGTTDIATRVLTEYLKKELGVPVIVENRTEASGVKGIVDVYKAKPDGYTLLVNLIPRNVQMEIVLKTPYKILDFVYLPAYLKEYNFVTVLKDSPYRTLKDLVEASKRKSLNCGIPGIGSNAHLNAISIKKKMGINLENVPFPEGGFPTMMALLGGHVDLAILAGLPLAQNIEKIRLLATFSEERLRKFPDVPTFKELGYDVPSVGGVFGICGPPHLPEEIRKTLSDAMVKAIKNPELISKIDKMGLNPTYMSGPEFRTLAGSFYKIIEEYKDLLMEK